MDQIKQAAEHAVQRVEEGFQAAPGSVQAIMQEAKHAVLNDEPTAAGENDQPVVSAAPASASR